MSKTDKELLELAAKAAGIDGSVDDEFGCGMWLRGKRNPDNSRYWSPLTDDGDAFRLAVKLRIAIRLDDKDAVSAGFSKNQDGAPTVDGNGPWFWKEWINGDSHNNGDPYAATRRAITRAAAAMGEKM